MNKIFTYCLFGFLFLMGATGLKSQSLTYGLVQDVNNPFQFTAVAYPTVSSGNVTIATAVFTFYLPAGTLTSPGIPVLPASGSFNNITGTWRIEKITPAYYAGFGFNAGDLQGRDVYQCILQDSPTPVFVANQPLSLFSFSVPEDCIGGALEVHVNNNAIRNALFNNAGININNEMSASVNDAPSVNMYVGNNPATDSYNCPLDQVIPIANPAAITACATVPNGLTAVFNLNSVTATVIAGNTETVAVTWFSDINLTIPINNPGSYVSPSATVYAKVTNVQSLEFVSAPVTLTVNPTPLADAGADVAICAGASVTLNGSGGTTCFWTPAAGLSNQNICNPAATPATSTLYTLRVTNAFACSDVDDVLVTVRQNQSIVCNDQVQVSLNENGLAFILPGMILEGENANEADLFTVTITTLVTNQPVPNPLTCANVGQTLRVRITDECNNNFCTGIITIEDKLPPVLECPCTATEPTIGCTFTCADKDGILNGSIATPLPVATDNCAGVITTIVNGPNVPGANLYKKDIYIDGGPCGIARIERTWTAKDAYGNSAQCTQIFYL
ncbi:MAG TPA: hypothetical protein PLO67_18430, partial [Saprospiraceae bacterium]|nr:hypothetical protein [Saprospiraceae bacterium]HPI08098.1 hypothetical protein [Saprospiraceae bacterium]